MRRPVLALISAFALPLLAAGPVPPTLRLPAGAAPLRCAVDLTIRPDQKAFSGTIDIEARVTRPSAVLWLNASGLSIQEATFTPAGGRALPAQPHQVGTDFLELAFPAALPVGQGRIHLRYTGTVSRKSTNGLFAQSENGQWYAYSQFESTYARKAFPCFDEPGFKVPWQLTLHVPQADMALSNTPIAAQHADPGGMKTVRFQTTKPLPSYLVALGVGPFDVIDAGKAGLHHTPIRIIVPHGLQGEAGYAAKSIPALFTRLEQYFGIPYPYPKLDSLVIPQTVAFGAMENAGLITYAQSELLAKPSELSDGFKRNCAETTAHEMAHQWFGDLVTMAWWNDIWLNEGFATWMENKITGEWRPVWHPAISTEEGRQFAMGQDSLLAARMIRQPIASKGDIENAFDGITYQKGAAVLSMFEAYLGPKAFQAGVRRYLRAHAYGNATTQDFLAALAAGGDRRIPAAFATFLDQAGVPMVDATLTPAPGGSVLHLTQTRYLPAGSKAPAAQTWQIPIRLRYTAHGKAAEKHFLMTTSRENLPLPVAPGDLGYLLLNQGMTGYYHTDYHGDLLPRLLAHEQALSVPERLGVFGDVSAAVQAGDMPVGEALALIPRFANDPNPYVEMVMVDLAQSVDTGLLPETERPAFARFVQSCFSAHAEALGFTPKAGESLDVRRLRPALLMLVAGPGRDLKLRRRAQELALKWLDDPKAVDPNVLGAVLGIAGTYGDKALFDRMLAKAKAAKEPQSIQRLLLTLGSFREPELQTRALDELLTDDFDPRMAVTLLWGGHDDPACHQRAYDFFKQHYEALMARLPPEFGIYMPLIASGFSDEAHRADVQAFFKDRVAKYPGAARNLAQTLEGIRIQEARVAAQQPGILAFLKPY